MEKKKDAVDRMFDDLKRDYDNAKNKKKAKSEKPKTGKDYNIVTEINKYFNF